MKFLHVYRSGRTFGVYLQPGRDGTGQELIEGGFFSRAAAEQARDRIANEMKLTDIAKNPDSRD